MTTANNAPISFRLTDEELELLRQHQEDGEKSLNLTAKRLLLNALGVDAKKPSLQVVNAVDTNQIKELIETAVQEQLTEFTAVDNVDTIKNLIAESLADGDIKDAIATSYKAAMGQFNGLLEELQDLKFQLQELKSISPVPVPHSPNNEQLTTDNGQVTEEETGNGKLETIPPAHSQLPTDDGQLTEDLEGDRTNSDQLTIPNNELIQLLGIEDILNGQKYWQNYLIESGIDAKITSNLETLKQMGIKFAGAAANTATGRLNAIVKFLGREGKRVGENRGAKGKIYQVF